MRLLANVDDVLEEVVPPVVARYRDAGTLSWALIHQIESDVLKEALKSGRLSAQAANMVRSHEAFGYPRDDRPASFEGLGVLPIVFGAIQNAWNRVH